MEIVSIDKDGNVTVKFTAKEARALRNKLEALPGSPAATELQRLLYYATPDRPAPANR